MTAPRLGIRLVVIRPPGWLGLADRSVVPMIWILAQKMAKGIGDVDLRQVKHAISPRTGLLVVARLHQSDL